jgi:hypothetical protein
MTWEIATNIEHPIGNIGNHFVITSKNSVDGRIIFTDNDGNQKSYTINQSQRTEFDLPQMLQNEWIGFDPIYVEFRTKNDTIETISIDLPSVNPTKN